MELIKVYFPHCNSESCVSTFLYSIPLLQSTKFVILYYYFFCLSPIIIVQDCQYLCGNIISIIFTSRPSAAHHRSTVILLCYFIVGCVFLSPLYHRWQSQRKNDCIWATYSALMAHHSILNLILVLIWINTYSIILKSAPYFPQPAADPVVS